MSQDFVARIYQKHIIEHRLEHKRCATFAGMGLGKTISELMAFDMELTAGYETMPQLVTAPLRVAQSTWPDEAKKWNHLINIEVQPIIGTVPERIRALRNTNASVFTINYENVPWLMEHIAGLHKGTHWPFCRVTADESTKLKGFRLRQGTKRAQALARIAHTCCSGWHNLTGTPSPNGLQDLWGQTWFLDAGIRLGRTFEAFRNRWFQKSFDGFSIEPLAHAQAEIQDRLKDICLSLDAADYFDIELPIENIIYIDLPTRARDLYRDMEKRMFMELEGHEVEAFNAAARTIKCLQIANGAAYVDPLVDDDDHPRSREWREVHDQKIQALEDVVEEAAGAPVLVAYNFKSDLARLKSAFPRARTLDDNPQTIRDWNACKIPILLTHPASAGHGLNLQDGGNILAFFGHDWNLENYLQIIERIGPTRQAQSGHNRPVFIHHIVARDTIEEDVMRRMTSKKQVQDILLEAMKRKGYA